VRARLPISADGSDVLGAVICAGSDPLLVTARVSGSMTRVRGVAGTPELVLGAVRLRFTPGAVKGFRMPRDVPVAVSAAESPVSGTVRALLSVRSTPDRTGSTRPPAAVFMAAEVVGAAERSTATERRLALRDDAVMGVRNMRLPVRSTDEKLVRVMPDCNSALRADAVMLRGPMVSGPRMTRRGE